MISIGLILAFMVVALLSGTVGLLLGGMLASSKVGALYDRVDRAEAAHRAQTELLDDLSEALRILVDDVAASKSGTFSADGSIGARKILERIALTAQMRANLEERIH